MNINRYNKQVGLDATQTKVAGPFVQADTQIANAISQAAGVGGEFAQKYIQAE